MLHVKKLRELGRGITGYIRSHLWVSIMGSLMLLFLLVVLIFQGYLKNAYYNYLLDETWKTESAVLSVASNSFVSMLEQALQVCGQMATDRELYNYVNRMVEADQESFIRRRSVLFSHLQSIAFHSTDVSCVTVVNQDGVLIEGARYWSGGGKVALWEQKDLDTLQELYTGVMAELGNKTSGHYKVSAIPAMYEPVSKMQVFHVAVPIIGFSSSFQRTNAVLVDTFGDLEFEIASEKVENVQFSVPGETLGYYIIAGGSPKGTVSKYCQLTGMPALPPAWSFGLWLTTSFTTNYDEETTSSFIQGMADRNIPLRVFHFDCYWMRAYRWCDFVWDPDTFPYPAGMLRRYHEKGLQICVWINPYIGQMSHLFKEGKDQGFLVKKENGDVWQTDLWQPGMALVDFTNPRAAAWYASKLEALLDMGVDCFKTDFGERVPVRGIRWFDGSDPNAMHNRYTLLYNRTVFELLERKRGKGEAVLFARSATVGGQQFPAHWGGDCSATYSSMAETLRGGLSLACGGFGFWSHDISGFEQTASPDIYKRWCQFGLLSSHSRLHGSSSYRVPWLFDEEACVVLKEMAELKCRLMPYLYRQAVIAHETGVPMLRPMFMEYPQDRTCHNLDLQYMLGVSLLAAPIFHEDGCVEYYLPEGKWVNLLTGEVLDGNRWHRGCFDYHSLPLMVAPNTILPLGSCQDKPDYDYASGVELCLSCFEEGASAEIQIPDLQGSTVMTASARRRGNTITVEVRGSNSWTCRMLGGMDADIVYDGSTARIHLK